MGDLGVEWLVGALTVIPFVLLYWIGRFVARKRARAALQAPRPWQVPTLQAWAERGWLDPQLAGLLPEHLSPAAVFYEWMWTGPDVAGAWRLREPIRAETPFEAVVRDAWANLPPELREPARERLAEAVVRAGSWWGGAERGWNGRPLSLLVSAVGKKEAGLPLLPVEDLTAAPLAGPIRAEAMAAEADGPDLVLALAALRRMTPRFMHPLAPREDRSLSLMTGLSTQIATDLGRRVGAGLGAALGPIGSMVGQYLGEMAGRIGGQKLVSQSLPAHITERLQETEAALVSLGRSAATDDFSRAAGRPAETVLELGKRIEVVREARSRRLRERIWPTAGLVLIEETMRVALQELQGYRAAAAHFVTTARKSPEAVAGGMILQNPWMVRDLPGGVERLNEARATLNRAASAIRPRS